MREIQPIELTKEANEGFIIAKSDNELVFELVDKFNMLLEELSNEYQDRLELIGVDGIGKYTLSEVESSRFMTDRQFNNLRASKQ